MGKSRVNLQPRMSESQLKYRIKEKTECLDNNKSMMSSSESVSYHLEENRNLF